MRGLRVMWLVAAFAAPALAAASDYVVIVNASNPVSTLSRSDASRFFLRNTTAWPNGERVKPVDLGRGSPVRAAFTKDVHGRSVGAIDQYWTQSVFSGRAVPPPEKHSDAEVVAYVRDTPGAIGYVSGGATTEGVRRVTLSK